MKNLVSCIFQILGLKGRGPKEGSLVLEPGFLEKVAEYSAISLLQGELNTGLDGECCVCLSTLGNGEEMRRLPCCHSFHRMCVDRWLNLCRRTCPLCRFSVDGEVFHMKEELTEEMVIWFSSFHVAGF